MNNLRRWIGDIAWRVLLWSYRMTAEQFKRSIYTEVLLTPYSHHNCRCVAPIEEADHDSR